MSGPTDASISSLEVALSAGLDGKGQGVGLGHSGERLDFLDWLRFLMVMSVVYAHTAVSLPAGGGFSEQWLIDDQTVYLEYSTYRNLSANGFPNPIGGPAPLSARWISIIRQWCLPLLFWVSGAAIACSYRGGAPRGLARLAGFSALGMVFNAVLWLLSPMRKHCWIDNTECRGQGLLFDFSICGRAGCWFAVIFQMWYTVFLFCFTVLNWPLFATVHGTEWPVRALCAQWANNMAIYVLFVFAPVPDGATVPEPLSAVAFLAASELLFLALVSLEVPRAPVARPAWLPTRAVHYLLGLVAVAQFGGAPFAEEIRLIGPAYLVFIFTGFNRFFNLGFVMTHARRSEDGDRVRPLLSKYWPLTLILATVCASSTNWVQAGMLTYPYYHDVLDRLRYVAGGVVIVFVLDRTSRGTKCVPLPEVLGNTSLALYLFHPCFITVLLALGFRSIWHVWVISMGMAGLFVSGVDIASGRACEGTHRAARGKSEGGLLSESEPSSEVESKESADDYVVVTGGGAVYT